MERGLLLVSLALAFLVWAMGFLPPRKPAALPWRAALPGLFAFLATLPKTGWFADGQALGMGLLVGTILATLSGWMVRQERWSAAVALAPVGAALVGLQNPIFPVLELLGIALGALATLITLAILEPDLTPGLTLAGSVTAATLATATLGTEHTNGGKIAVWVVPSALTAAVGTVLAWLLGRFVPEARRTLGALALAVALPLVLRLALAKLSLPLSVAPYCIGGGVALSVLLSALLKGEATDRRTQAALLLLGALLVAVHFGQGHAAGLVVIGLGIGALAGGTLVELALPLAFATLFVLFRLFVQLSPEVRSYGLHEQYFLIGLLVGGTLAPLGANLASRYPTGYGVAKVASVALALPLMVSVLYGPHAALSVLIGLLASTFWRLATEKPTPTIGPLLSLAVGTVLVAFLGHLTVLAEGSRLDRLKLCGITLAVVLAVFVVTRFLGKKKS